MNMCGSMYFAEPGYALGEHSVSLELFFNGFEYICNEVQIDESNQTELKSSSKYRDYNEAVDYLEARSLNLFEKGMSLQNQKNCDFNSKVIRQFKPAAQRHLIGESLHNQFLSKTNWAGFGINDGQRVYIEFLSGEIHRVIDADGNPFILPAKLQQALGSPFPFTQTVMIEAYIDPNILLITDLAALEYAYCDFPSSSRNELLHTLIEPNDLVQVCQLVDIDIDLLHEDQHCDETNARYFVVFDSEKGFKRPDELSNSRFLIPRFYSIEMTVLAELSKADGYALGYWGTKELLAVAHVKTKELLAKGQEVVVNFSELDDGEFKGAWLGDNDTYCNHHMRQHTQSDLSQLSSCWAARRNINEVERNECWKKRDKSF